MQPSERTRPPRAHSFWYPDGLGDPVDVTGDSEIPPSRAFAGAAGGAGWNDDVLDREGRILPTLLRAALGYRK